VISQQPDSESREHQSPDSPGRFTEQSKKEIRWGVPDLPGPPQTFDEALPAATQVADLFHVTKVRQVPPCLQAGRDPTLAAVAAARSS
jgi:hypothetical protein